MGCFIKKTGTLLLFLVAVSLLAVTAQAAVIDSASNTFDVAANVIADKSVEGDYIAFGGNVKLEAGVTGDIIAAGRNVVITDENAVQNIFAAGQHVAVHAKKVRNIYAAAGDITINTGTEAGGLYLAGGTVTVGGIATDASIVGASVTVDGTIYENLTIRSDNITFGQNVTVGGRITVYGTVKPELPPGIDASKLTFKRVMHIRRESPQPSGGVSRMGVVMALVGIVTAIAIALLLTLLRGAFFRERAAEFRKKIGKSLLYGVLAFIVVPVAAVACMLSVFAIPIGLIVLLLYGIVLYVSPVVTGMVLGRLAWRRGNRWLTSALGAAVVSALLLVPILKVVLFLACAFYTLGITAVLCRPHREKPDRGALPPDRGEDDG